MNRFQAGRLGLKIYNVGEPCVHGHVEGRYVSNGICVVCSKARSSANTYKTNSQLRDAKFGISQVTFRVRDEHVQLLRDFAAALEATVVIDMSTPFGVQKKPVEYAPVDIGTPFGITRP